MFSQFPLAHVIQSHVTALRLVRVSHAAVQKVLLVIPVQKSKAANQTPATKIQLAITVWVHPIFPCFTLFSDLCDPNPCQNGGACNYESVGFSCSCTEGYTGDTCTEVLYCHPNPCQNEGACFEVDSGFECTCTSGFAGETCGASEHIYSSVILLVLLYYVFPLRL